MEKILTIPSCESERALDGTLFFALPNGSKLILSGEKPIRVKAREIRYSTVYQEGVLALYVYIEGGDLVEYRLPRESLDPSFVTGRWLTLETETIIGKISGETVMGGYNLAVVPTAPIDEFRSLSAPEQVSVA